MNSRITLLNELGPKSVFIGQSVSPNRIRGVTRKLFAEEPWWIPSGGEGDVKKFGFEERAVFERARRQIIDVYNRVEMKRNDVTSPLIMSRGEVRSHRSRSHPAVASLCVVEPNYFGGEIFQSHSGRHLRSSTGK